MTSWWDRIAAISAAAQTVLVAAALVYARGQLREAARARDEAAQIHEATERPYVTVDFDEQRVMGIIHLVVRNHGRSMARDVRFTFTPPLTSSVVEPEGLAIFNRVIPTMAPGRELVLLFDSAMERRAPAHSDVYDVEVSYDGDVGRARYVDHIRLDLGIFWGMEYVAQKGLHELAEDVRDLARTARSWTAPSRGLHVRTDADMAQESARRREQLEAARSRQQSRRGKK